VTSIDGTGSTIQQFVIVGAGLAGAKAAETLRAEGFGGRIVLMGAESVRPYERPPLSKDLLLGKQKDPYVHPEQWYAEHDIDLRLGLKVTRIDRAARVVHTDDGPVRYDKLLLATGSSPRRLRVPGADLDGVRYLRTLADSEEIRRRLAPGVHVVVAGAGWIGLEVAAAARAAGAQVTVVELAQLPLQRVLGDELGQVFADLHQAHGVSFRFGTTVQAIAGSSTVDSVVLSSGGVLHADLVVAGVGISPVVDLAEQAGLAVSNGIRVDASLRTSDEHIYAAGDVANADHPLLGVPLRVEHWANALNGGAAAARSMLGREVSYDRLPYFYTDQYDLGCEYVGHVTRSQYDSVVFRGDPAIVDGRAPEFIAFWLRDDRVLAAMNVNVWDVQKPLQRLIRAGYAGRTVDRAALVDPSVDLATLA
jgi:NADPH-dependent 2,4-dienoyl-CoA reductase/sulfur reductase-like enzyme